MTASKATQSEPTSASEVRLVEVLDAYMAAAQEGLARRGTSCWRPIPTWLTTSRPAWPALNSSRKRRSPRRPC